MSGCLTNLYESIENLNDTYIQSKQCKDVLLKPKSSLGISSIPFLLLNNTTPIKRTFYGCSYSYSHARVSDDPNAIYPDCGINTLSRKLEYIAPPQGVKEPMAATKGFVKEFVTYMVMDDLVVKPMSTVSSITLLNKFNVKDVGVLQEKVVLKLLEESFESKSVLTNVFMSCVKTEK
ncbi:unnamed protein product [Withania somnifera]